MGCRYCPVPGGGAAEPRDLRCPPAGRSREWREEGAHALHLLGHDMGHQPTPQKFSIRKTNLDKIWAPRRKGWGQAGPHLFEFSTSDVFAGLLTGAYLRPIPSRNQLSGRVVPPRMGSGKADPKVRFRDRYHEGV